MDDIKFRRIELARLLQCNPGLIASDWVASEERFEAAKDAIEAIRDVIVAPLDYTDPVAAKEIVDDFWEYTEEVYADVSRRVYGEEEDEEDANE